MHALFDVAVFGDGPAGAAVTLEAAKAGRSVILFGRGRDQELSAGETLSPEVYPTLLQLGVWQQFLAHEPKPTHGIWSAWGGPRLIAQDFVRSPYGPAWRMEKSTFGRMLIEESAQAGARVTSGWDNVALGRVPEGWQISGHSGGKRQTIRAKFVIDASGRGAGVARACGARWQRYDGLVALIGRLTPTGATASREDVLLLESSADGWWYSSVLDDGDLVAAFLTDGDLIRRRHKQPEDMWSAALDGSNVTRERVSGFTKVSFGVRSSAVGRAGRAAGPGWMAVGDAASTIDPLSGAGTVKALKGAIQAARALGEAFSGSTTAVESYADRVGMDFEASLAIRSEYYSKELRWPDSPFWQRRRA